MQWIQGAETALIIAVISVGMHVVVRLSGDLYTAMALHFVYDLLAGIVLRAAAAGLRPGTAAWA